MDSYTNRSGGFSFCNVDCAKFGLTYAPDLNDTFVYKNSVHNIYDEEIPAKYGGLYYGTNPKPKEFNLRCYFEQKHLNHGDIDVVLNFFKIGKTGRLVFDTRDWMWYSATVVNVDISPTNLMNGLIVIRFKAYYPFARTDLRYAYDENDIEMFDNYDYNCYEDTMLPVTGEEIEEFDSYITYAPTYSSFDFDDEEDTNEHIMGDTIMDYDSVTFYPAKIDQGDFEIMPDYEVFLDTKEEAVFTEDTTIHNKAFFLRKNQSHDMSFKNVTSTKSFLIYNAGNAIASLSVGFKGEAGDVGLIIRNNTNENEMKFIGFKRSDIGDGYIYTDSLNGKTSYIDSNGNHTLKFVYHDHGYIHLDPASPVALNTRFKASEGSSVVKVDSYIDDLYTGKYILFDDTWYKIIKPFNANSVVLERPAEKSGIFVSHVLTMNEITIEIADDGTEIDEIFFDYRHTFR